MDQGNRLMKKALGFVLAVTVCLTGHAAQPLQLLDASVSSNVVGNPVTQWLDQSGNDYHAVNDTGDVFYPGTSLSPLGKAGLDFGTGPTRLELFSAADAAQWLDQSGSTNGFCVLVVFKCDGLVGTWNDLIGNTSAAANTTTGFGMRWNQTGAMQAYLAGNSLNKGGEAVAAGDTIVFGFNYNAVAGAFQFWDSKNDSLEAKRVAAADFSAGSVTLGNTSNAGRYFNGMVGEVRIFDHMLGAVDFQAQTDELVGKWMMDIAPPAAPTGLVAVAGTGQVDLDWTDSAEGDLSGYTVYRSNTSGSNYVAIATDVADSGFTDTAVANQTTYYYAVAACDVGGNESELSDDVSAQPTGPAPEPGSGIITVEFSTALAVRETDVPITLSFTVDEFGNVMLDAATSSVDSNAVETVNGWDGFAGTLFNPDAFHSAFSISISAENQTGAAWVNLSEVDAGGLAVQGQNSSRIDGTGVGNGETLRLTPSVGAAQLEFKTLSWNNSVSDVIMTASAGETMRTHLIGNTPGTWGLADSEPKLTVATDEALELSTASANGYALAGLTFSLIPPAPRTNVPPNVVVILADDLGYSDISYNPCHGPEISTPNIDSLIRSGVWFSDAYASGNICAPSRSGFFIGSYQQRVGIHVESDVNGDGIPYSMPIFPEHLKQSLDGIEDYVCKMVGKYHMGRDRTATVSIDGNGDGDFTDYGTNKDPIQPDDYGFADPATTLRHPMNRGFDQVYGFINLGGQSYWDYEMGFYEDYYRHNAMTPIDGIDDGDAVETYLTTRFTDKACEFIEEQAAAGNPFYLHLAYNAVHTPMQAPATPAGLSEGDPGWFPDAEYYKTNYPDMWQSPTYFKPADLDTQAEIDALQETRSILMAMLYHMDQGIGRVIDTLKAEGVWENTLVVFWSDNGGAKASGASNNPLREQKHFNYEGGIRVPMSICWPAVLGAYSNTTVSAPVMSIDIVPTVLDAAGIEPINGFDAFDGKSWLPLIRREVDNIHDELCWSEGGTSGEYSIRQGDWKLYIDEDVYELYNLRDDIGESTDLSAVEPGRVRSMRQDFFAWMNEMVNASGDNLDDRLWTTTSTPDGSSAITFQGGELSDGMLQIKYDEKFGWLTSGPVFEASDNLLSNDWKTVTPQQLQQIDRYLDESTYRAGFPMNRTHQYFRVVEP